MITGNPDQGSGWYAKKLDPDAWLELNQALRSHMNWVENLPYVILLPPIAGLFFPIPALVGVSVFFVARILYGAGYNNNSLRMLRPLGVCL